MGMSGRACFSQESPCFGLVEEWGCWQTQREGCDHPTTFPSVSVLLPSAVPRLPGWTVGSFSRLPSPSPTHGSGRVGCSLDFWSITGGLFQSAYSSICCALDQQVIDEQALWSDHIKHWNPFKIFEGACVCGGGVGWVEGSNIHERKYSRGLLCFSNEFQSQMRD